jgi:hypothetical protein
MLSHGHTFSGYSVLCIASEGEYTHPAARQAPGVHVMLAIKGIACRLFFTVPIAAGVAGFLQTTVPQPAAAADGQSPLDIFIQSYIDEWGKPPKSDPNAPPSRWPTSELPPQPQTTPPYPFTEWPFGGSSAIGATVPNSQAAH